LLKDNQVNKDYALRKIILELLRKVMQGV